MQAQYAIHRTSPRAAVWALAVVLLVLISLAGGYAIRLATSSSTATHSAITVQQGSASQPAASDTCIFVGDRKAC
jgi:hypothetical protein